MTSDLGVEHVLLLCEPLGAAPQEVGRLALVQRQTTGVAGVEVLESEPLPFLIRNGWTYFSMRSRISFLAIAQTPFAEPKSSVRSTILRWLHYR